MGKQKSMLNDTTKYSTTTKKTSSKKRTNNTEDVDSLNCFKQEKPNNIDDKFNLLKSELQSLFYNPKAEINNSESKIQATNADKPRRLQCATASSESTKFSEWLSETIDKMDGKSHDTSTSDRSDFSESLTSTPHLKVKSKYNMTLLPKYKVERLLYKSFQLKNLGIYVLSSSDESDTEQSKSSRVRKHKTLKRWSRRQASSFPRRSLKRKRCSLNNEVEVINLDNTLNNNEPKVVDYVDLVSSYDWSEPFNTSSESDNSDLEIIEDSEVDDKMEKQNKKNAGSNGNNDVNLKCGNSTTDTQDRNIDKNFMSLTSPDGKKAWECPICFESSQGQTIVATQCGHIFCKACLEKNNSTQGEICPTCRFNLKNKPPIILFNL